ncbi:MAG: class I tRNA ligase family protein, partial [Anaerolineae bacterium]|nr:class I tRNA ligase family protein [Anaerolineae bacterium]
FALLQQAGKGQDIRFSVSRVEAIRSFCNKIWNIARFVMLNLDLDAGPPPPPESGELRAEDKWIVSRLQRAIGTVNSSLATYDLDNAARTLYDFLWSEYADWYIEISKPRLEGTERSPVQYVLWHVLETSVRLLHPFMPFITERVWQSIPHEGESIMIVPFPEVDDSQVDESVEHQMDTIMDVTRTIRNLRAELGVPHAKAVASIVVPSSSEAKRAIDTGRASIGTLAKVSKLELAETAPTDEQARFISAHLASGDVYIPVAGLIDLDREIARVANQLAEVEKELARSRGKLSNEQFMSRAPAHIVEKQRRIVQELDEKREKLEQRLGVLRG